MPVIMFETLTAIDLAILHAVHDALASPMLDTVMPFITSLGNLGFIWFLVAAALMCQKKYRIYGVAVLIAVATQVLIGEFGIKNLIERARPFLVDPALTTDLIRLPVSYSFPSGHTGSSFAAATALCFIPLAHNWVKAIPLCGAGLVAFSRIYLCVHYPSDVLGGIILGVACGIFAGMLVRKWQREAQLEAAAPPPKHDEANGSS